MADFITLQTQAINTELLKLKVLNGRSYLTGPVIMAKECVMNGLLYPKTELTRSIGGWNGRPVTVGHPKVDGKNVSANSPTILDSTQIGFIFDTLMRDDDGALQSEVWLDVTKIDMFPEVRDTVQNGSMLEVSTGLFLDQQGEAGEFNGVKYNAIAANHLPDHLALLPGEVGACSIKDGAGFPRANSAMTANEVTYSEKCRILRTKLQSVMEDQYFYVVEIFDSSIVYGVYGDFSNDQKLYAREYRLDKETGALTVGEAVEVFQKVEYPPITSLGVNDMANETPNVEKSEVVTPNVDSKGTAKVEEAKVVAEPTPNTDTEPAPSKVEEPVTEPVVAPEANADVLEAMEVLQAQKTICIKEILGNAQNAFTEDELGAMKYSDLKKISSLAKSTHANVDRAGMGGPGGINASGSSVQETPYVGA